MLFAGEPAPPPPRPPAYIVDDDREIRCSAVLLLRAVGITARAFASGEDLLDDLDSLQPGCLLIDIRMPGLTGLELLARLRERDCLWPSIIITGHGEIAAAVRAVKLGAVEFLEKPYSPEELFHALDQAFEGLDAAVQRSAQAKRARHAFALLSPRERQVFDGVVAGQTSKEIAAAHGLSHRTVEAYRVNMMTKLGAKSPHDLHAIASVASPQLP